MRACGELTTSAGIPVTGTMSFLNAMFAVMDKYQYDCVIPCAEGGNNWRKKESTEYKANRTSADIAHYADQSLLLDEVLPVLGMSVVRAPGYEADDVIAHISRHSPAYEEIHILTCDKDLLQLVTNRVKVLLFNSSKKMELVDIDGVIKQFGVFPAEVKYFKALAGDSSDNVAGIPKVGPKTAVQIIESCRPIVDDSGEKPFFSTADRIVSHPKVREQAGTFLANLRLVTLENDLPDLRWFASSSPVSAHVEALFESLEFRQLLKRKTKIMETLGCQKDVSGSSC
jgi:DNA polymerase-1